MRKLIRLLIPLFILYIFIEFMFNIFSKGYKIEYKVDGFNILEQRVKRTKGEIDNYYFEIKTNDNLFNFQTHLSINTTEKVINKIAHYKDDYIECILPITKKDTAISDFQCIMGGNYYNYNSIIGQNNELDKFVELYSHYRESFKTNDNVIESDSKIAVYNNFEDNLYLGLEYYKGVYSLNKKGYTNIGLFEKDIYTKDISTFVGDYYVVADYTKDYGFHKFYLINLLNNKKSIITADNEISMYSYIQGNVGDSIYLIDITNKLQYEIDLSTKTVIIVGNEKDGIKYYNNGEWNVVSIYDALNTKLLFKTSINTFDEKAYVRVDNVGGKKSGFYYLYEKENNHYKAYRVSKQNINIKTYLFDLDNIDDIKYDFDYIFYKDSTYIKYYSNLTGVKILAKYDEVSFNKTLKFNFVR